MSNQSLSSLTLRTIENYRHAATQAVTAYRAGSRRLIRVVNRSLDKNVDGRAADLAPRLAASLKQARSTVTEIVSRGVDGVATNTGRLIEISSAAAIAPVKKAAELADAIDSRIVVDGIDAATRLALPGAKFALAVSTKVAGGADALADAVVHAGGETVGTVATRAKRQAAAVSRKASAGAGQVKRQVKKAAAAPKAAARRAVRKAR